jgi:hypothetical protein
MIASSEVVSGFPCGGVDRATLDFVDRHEVVHLLGPPESAS